LGTRAGAARTHGATRDAAPRPICGACAGVRSNPAAAVTTHGPPHLVHQLKARCRERAQPTTIDEFLRGARRDPAAMRVCSQVQLDPTCTNSGARNQPHSEAHAHTKQKHIQENRHKHKRTQRRQAHLTQSVSGTRSSSSPSAQPNPPVRTQCHFTPHLQVTAAQAHNSTSKQQPQPHTETRQLYAHTRRVHRRRPTHVHTHVPHEYSAGGRRSGTGDVRSRNERRAARVRVHRDSYSTVHNATVLGHPRKNRGSEGSRLPSAPAVVRHYDCAHVISDPPCRVGGLLSLR
jgi:hypothetical protein